MTAVTIERHRNGWRGATHLLEQIDAHTREVLEDTLQPGDRLRVDADGNVEVLFAGIEVPE